MHPYHISALPAALCCLLLMSPLSADDSAAKQAPLRASELNERPVVGQLGVPLGTCGEIQARIMAGRDLNNTIRVTFYP